MPDKAERNRIRLFEGMTKVVMALPKRVISDYGLASSPMPTGTSVLGGSSVLRMLHSSDMTGYATLASPG